MRPSVESYRGCAALSVPMNPPGTHCIHCTLSIKGGQNASYSGCQRRYSLTRQRQPATHGERATPKGASHTPLLLIHPRRWSWLSVCLGPFFFSCSTPLLLQLFPLLDHVARPVILSLSLPHHQLVRRVSPFSSSNASLAFHSSPWTRSRR